MCVCCCRYGSGALFVIIIVLELLTEVRPKAIAHQRITGKPIEDDAEDDCVYARGRGPYMARIHTFVQIEEKDGKQ